mmetsp:Transcript_9738/g.31165  ORF Transcript_9738/g.31165 Transcript_9738/m.31165 type:complete len:359 (+) Transcript_9738:402-1478(+)
MVREVVENKLRAMLCEFRKLRVGGSRKARPGLGQMGGPHHLKVELFCELNGAFSTELQVSGGNWRCTDAARRQGVGLEPNEVGILERAAIVVECVEKHLEVLEEIGIRHVRVEATVDEQSVRGIHPVRVLPQPLLQAAVQMRDWASVFVKDGGRHETGAELGLAAHFVARHKPGEDEVLVVAVVHLVLVQGLWLLERDRFCLAALADAWLRGPRKALVRPVPGDGRPFAAHAESADPRKKGDAVLVALPAIHPVEPAHERGDKVHHGVVAPELDLQPRAKILLEQHVAVKVAMAAWAAVGGWPLEDVLLARKLGGWRMPRSGDEEWVAIVALAEGSAAHSAAELPRVQGERHRHQEHP